MKAAILSAPNALSLQDIAPPALEDGDLLVRVRAATLCGTDIRIFRGRKTAGVRYPSVIGHEFAGVVVDAGGHETYATGDRIALCPAMACGRCALCKRGRENLCESGFNVGYEIDGAFAELIRIPASAVHAGNVCLLPDHVHFEEAALVEPLACVLNGQDLVDLSSADTVVVLGGGPIGQLHVKLARLRGARRILLSDPNAPRRAMALSGGADVVIDAREEDVKKRVHEETAGRGTDVAICAIGNAALARQATDMVAHAGRVSLFAGFSAGETALMDVNAIHYRELQLTGAFGLSRRNHDQAFELIASGRLDVKPLITHRFALNDVVDAFHTAESNRAAIKVAIVND